MTLSTPSRSSYDAIVVGARCAGAATALQMARRGLRVLAVERGSYGSDTLSTHALMRAGVLQLHRWGVLDRLRDEGTPPVPTTAFHYGDEPPVVVEIKSRDGVDALYAPRRHVLDRVLVDAAREAGVEVLHETRVVELLRSADRVSGAVIETRPGRPLRVEAPLVVGADGVRSTVAREVGAETELRGRHATAVVYAYWRGLSQTGYRWFFRPDSSAGSIPTNDGETLVFASLPSRRLDRLRRGGEAGYFEVLRATDPELAAELDGAERIGRFWGFPGQLGFFRRSHGPGWALVGDAGYFKDPITAHGISDALRDAELLASWYCRQGQAGLASYQQERDALSRPLFEVTDRLAAFDWDLETAKELHLELSREMNREVDVMKEWHQSEALAAAS